MLPSCQPGSRRSTLCSGQGFRLVPQDNSAEDGDEFHFAPLVLGPDPQDRATGLDLPGEWGVVESALIGGMYSGLLVPVSGATSARVYGDALPDGGAHMFAWLGQMVPYASVTRPGRRGRGVDQVQVGEPDIAVTLTRDPPLFLLDLDGLAHWIGNLVDPSVATVDRWRVRLEGMLRAADPETLVSVVDVRA
jgi:hypothetical protein